MKKVLLLTILLSIVSLGRSVAQEKKLTARVIKTISVKVEVIGILENTGDLVVLRVLDVEDNTIRLKKNDEFLAKFYFGTKPAQAKNPLPGVNAGDIISADIDGVSNSQTGQMDYTVFDYRAVNTLKSGPSQDSKKKDP